MAIGAPLAPDARQRVFTNLGVFAPGAKWNTYAAGTSTPIVTYSDSALTTPNTNPLIASASGLFGPVYLQFGTAYRFLMTDTAGVTIWDQDNIQSTSGSAVATTTATGTQNNLPVDANVTLLRCNNASALTITGLGITGGALAPISGQVLTVVSVGAGQVAIDHQSVGSTAQYRLVNFATVGSTYLAAGKGVAVYQYDGTTLRWRLVAHDQGDWIAQPYTGSDYTASSGTWTVSSGDVSVNAFYLKGKQLFVKTVLTTTSTSATPATLIQQIPGGYSVIGTTATLYGPYIGNPAGVFTVCRMQALGFFLSYFPTVAGTGTWTTVANTLEIAAAIDFLVT